MAFLSSGPMWVHTVNTASADLAAEITNVTRLERVLVVAVPESVNVAAVHVDHLVPPVEAAHRAVRCLAPLWVDMVDDGVPCVVIVDDATWVTDGATMAAVAGGKIEQSWWEQRAQVE